MKVINFNNSIIRVNNHVNSSFDSSSDDYRNDYSYIRRTLNVILVGLIGNNNANHLRNSLSWFYSGITGSITFLYIYLLMYNK